MTETTNINTPKGKFLAMAIMLVAFLAIAAAALAATAKPAEAATGTTCSNAAHAPVYYHEGGTRYIVFKSSVKCSNYIDAAGMETVAYQKISGVWKPMRTDYFIDHGNRSYYYLNVALKCGKPYTAYKFKTVQNRTQTKALNGTIKSYPNRYSGEVTLYC